MTDSSYNTSDSSASSFVQINEEDVDLRPPAPESQAIKCEKHDAGEEWAIKAESEFNTQLYYAGRVATIGILGPHQSGKTSLINHLSRRAISFSHASASAAINRGLRRTVFIEAWRSYCKVSRNNASPSYVTFFIDTPGHPQQLPESISVCCRLKTIILMVNMCAGLQFDHTMYLNALEERLLTLHKQPHSPLQLTCILAFSNVDKFCYEVVSRVHRKNISQCCLVQYIALHLHLQIEFIKTSICRECPWLKDLLSHQILLCYYNCMKQYCLTSNQATDNSMTYSFTTLECIVDSLLNGTELIPESPAIYNPNYTVDQSPVTINSDTIKSLFICCCPYKLYAPWSAYIFYTPSILVSSEEGWRQLLGDNALGPLIEESDGSLRKLSAIPADTVFIILTPSQSGDDSISWLEEFNQSHTFYPYITHIQLPIKLAADALQLSIYFPGLSFQKTKRTDVLEVRARGEYIINLFLSIFHLVVQKFLANKLPQQGESAIKTLPLLPVLKKCISHAAQSPTQLKIYLDESRGLINLTISIVLRESPPPPAWGYKIGTQRRSDLLSTLDPTVSVYNQIATLYANRSYTFVDGTIQCDIVNASEGEIILTSQLTHLSTLIDALKEAIRKEEESSLIPFHNLQIIVLNCKCYQKAQHIHLHASTLFSNAIASSKLYYMEPILYAQMFITTGIYRTKKEQGFLSDALDKLKCLLCSRRCTFVTDPWIQRDYPIPTLSTIFFYIPAGSALGLEIAIEHIIRCTSVNIYHDEQIYFTRTVNTNLDPADLKGTVDAMKSRFSVFNKK